MITRLISLYFIFFSVGCNHFLYYPTRIKYANEQKFKIVPKQIFFTDGTIERLAGWYFTAPKDKSKKTTLLFFHGNGENMSSHFTSLYWILNKGYDYLIFDYPGYGISSGDPDPTNTVESGKAAMDWLKTNKPNQKIAIFAQSLGGNIALRMLGEGKYQPCLTIIDSSFPSYKEAARKVLNKNWFTWPIQYLSYIFISDAKAAEGVLNQLPNNHYIVVHGTQDSIVPFELGEDLYRKIEGSKDFWEVEGADHIRSFTKVPLRKKLVNSLNRYCKN